MSDQLPENPGQQPPSGQHANPAPVISTGIDWEARYKGASQKINELTTEIAGLKAQLSANASEMEQLRTSLSVKDVEKDAAVGSYKTQLEKAMADTNTAAVELKELRALKAKLEMTKKLNAPHLVPILDKIPFVENPDAMEEVMKTFLDWGKELVQEREKQLLAGVTPAPAAATTPAKALPTNSKDWQAYVNSFPPGSPEREQAYEQWWKAGQSAS